MGEPSETCLELFHQGARGDSQGSESGYAQRTLSRHGENSWQQLLRFPPSAFSTLQLLKSRFQRRSGALHRAQQKPLCHLGPGTTPRAQTRPRWRAMTQPSRTICCLVSVAQSNIFVLLLQLHEFLHGLLLAAAEQEGLWLHRSVPAPCP